MYTPDQYARAKAQLSGAPPEAQAVLRRRMSEFEHANPQGGRGQRFTPPAEEAGSPVGQVPKGVPEEAPGAASASHGDFKAKADPLQQYSDQVNTPPAGMDVSRDLYLPTASKLNALKAPPEYVAKNPLAGIKHVLGATAADPLEGPGAGVYHEPTEQKFQADMTPVLNARGIQQGSAEYQDAFNEYKDRKWLQAYQDAEKNDTPLTRAEYVDHSGAWNQLKDALRELPDVASSFAKGYASGGTLHATEAIETETDREQSRRDPFARGAGELAGAFNPGSVVARGASYLGKGIKYLPGIAGRVLGGAGVGAAAGGADLAGREGARALRDVAGGGTATAAKEEFERSLPGAMGIGGLLGGAGSLIAEGANALQKRTLATTPEIGQLRRGGGDTDALLGVTPGKEIAGNLEAAREPIPGEAKTPPVGNATELAAKKVQGPLADANAGAHRWAHERIASEQGAAIEANPKLREQLPANNTANAAVEWALSKLQPEARSSYLPGVSKPLSAEVLPAADIAEVQRIAPRLWKPRVVLAVDADSVGNRALGKAITLDEARKLGLDVGGLSKELSPETGVPLDAPPIPNEPVDVAKTLPRYSKEQLGQSVAGEATPEEAAAIKRYTFGKRNPGDQDLIERYLAKAPVSPLPHVYRGLTMSAEDAADFLANKTFDTGSSPASVSADPITARSFVARNQKPGQVGITLKLEHSSARDIASHADPQVSVEKELLLPRDTNFEIVSKVKDPTNPDGWIVAAREVPKESSPRTSIKDVFGVDAEKVPPAPPGTSLAARPGRAFKTPAAPPDVPGDPYGTEAKRAESTSLHLGSYEVKDPFGGWGSTVPSGQAPPETPTRPVAAEPSTASATPSGPPRELRTPIASARPASSQGSTSPPPSGPVIGGIPESEYRVILEPRRFDAKTFEEILGDVDRKAKAGNATATPDPAWKQLQRAVREDREQFGPEWSRLIAKHHELLNNVEQRSYHAGINEKKPYSEMQGSSQQTMNGKLVDFPGGADSQKALRSLAAEADPQVLHDLEVLGGQNAYSKLSGMANPKIGETIGSGGLAGHLRGFGPAVKLRADALARGVSAGPTGEPTVTPRVVDFVRKNAPRMRPLAGATAMGNGALGLKAGSVYGSTRDRGAAQADLNPSEQQFLDQLIQAVQADNQKKKAALAATEAP